MFGLRNAPCWCRLLGTACCRVRHRLQLLLRRLYLLALRRIGMDPYTPKSPSKLLHQCFSLTRFLTDEYPLGTAMTVRGPLSRSKLVHPFKTSECSYLPIMRLLGSSSLRVVMQGTATVCKIVALLSIPMPHRRGACTETMS